MSTACNAAFSLYTGPSSYQRNQDPWVMNALFSGPDICRKFAKHYIHGGTCLARGLRMSVKVSVSISAADYVHRDGERILTRRYLLYKHNNTDYIQSTS